MTVYRCTIFALLFTLLPYFSFAQDSSSLSKSELIDKIITETNVSEELNQPIEELKTQFAQNPFGLPSAKNERMMDLFSEAFEPESTLKTIHNTFTNNFDGEHAESVINWLDKKKIQQVHSFEEDFYTLQGIRKRIVSKYELEQDPPGKDRKQLIQSLAKKTSAANTEIEARATIFRALINAFSEISEQRSFSSSQVNGFVDNFRSQIRTEIDEQVNSHLMTKYHGLDDKVLQEYISFYDTESGKWLNKTASESILAALNESADRFLTLVGDME